MSNVIEKIFFDSKYLNRYVQILIRFPKNYENIKETCHALYIHDGQNAFFKEEGGIGEVWGFNETLNEIEEEGHKPTVAIGFYCAMDNEGIERYREYSYFDNNNLIEKSKRNEDRNFVNTKDKTIRAKGDLHIKFLVEELMPYVEDRYNIGKSADNRSVIGSSMGGLSSTVIGLLHQDKFGYAYCVSNAYWYNEFELIKLIENTNKTHNIKFYLDIGDKEVSSGFPDEEIIKAYLATNINVNEALSKKGYETVFNIVKGGEHNELSWNKRLKEILLMKKI